MLMDDARSSFLADQWLDILESLEDGVIVIGNGGRVEYVNQGAALLTDLSQQAPGQGVDDLLARNRWLAELLATTRATGLHNVQAEASLAGRYGREHPVRAAATLLVDQRGAQVGTLLTLHDLSYQRELEARALEADRLGQLEILLAGLAHEIKNPLSGMRGAAQLLARHIDTDHRLRECTRIILTEIDRLNGLMTQLLDLTGPPRLERAPINIHEIIDRVLEIEGTSGLRFLRHYDPSLPLVLGDRDRLTQVILNLLRNAVEASPPAGTVTVTTRMETSYYVSRARGRDRFLSIDVSDEGPGIPAENLSRLFAPFFTTKTGGTGLGLAISQRIVAEHGGVLRARGEAGRGAVFTVTLPVERESQNG
jgi:two-component system, NtrC family, nitrogen regulation sensor histidine kinase GlnL